MPVISASSLISIHLMLWFYLRKEVLPIPMGQISIHLMLWFYQNGVDIGQNRLLFQYISCYGSMILSWHLTITTVYFNTSHVMVLFDADLIKAVIFWFQYISCYGSIGATWNWLRRNFIISIHLMLWFYFSSTGQR